MLLTSTDGWKDDLLMTIRDLYRPGKFGLSIEIFPPKTSAGDAGLFETLDRLTTYCPGFVSCTYGAGGTTRHRTVELCVEIQRRYGVAVTSHFTSNDPAMSHTTTSAPAARSASTTAAPMPEPPPTTTCALGPELCEEVMTSCWH